MDARTTALIVIDVQNGFVNRHSRAVIPAIVRLVAAWQQAGAPVVFARFHNEPGSPYETISGWTRLRTYAASSLSGFLGGWFSVLDFARSSGLLDDVPGSFSRARHHRVALVDPNEEQAGRALPDNAVRQLDASLHLLAGRHRGWSAETSQRFYQTAYAILRDTGRRLGEVVTLKTQCVEFTDGNPELVYDNRKAGRHGRRLPITRELADLILEWEKHRATLPLSPIAQPWLFPSSMHLTRGAGHIRGDSLAASLRDWVRSIPQLDGELIGPDGVPLPFDRSLITAHAFRHTYAQRHADAGVPVDVLRDLMDHRSVDTTMGYYNSRELHQTGENPQVAWS